MIRNVALVEDVDGDITVRHDTTEEITMTLTNDNTTRFIEAAVVINRITRTHSGLRLWFSNDTLVGRRFRATICDRDNLLLDQAASNEIGIKVIRSDRGKRIAALAVWPSSTMGGPRLDLRHLHIAPTVVDDKYGFVIPGIPDLTENRIRQPYPREKRTQHLEQVAVEWLPPEPMPWPVEPTTWTVERLKQVLSEVRAIEAGTGYRLGRDEEGRPVFTAPAITL